MHSTSTEYREGLAAQATALRELTHHAERLLAPLPWVTDEVAEVYALLEQRAVEAARACMN